jgi:hypothetical protein
VEQKEHSFSSEANCCLANKKVPGFYGYRIFIAVFTKACNWTPSKARGVEATPFNPVFFRSKILLFSDAYQFTPESSDRSLPFSRLVHNLICMQNYSCT